MNPVAAAVNDSFKHHMLGNITLVVSTLVEKGGMSAENQQVLRVVSAALAQVHAKAGSQQARPAGAAQAFKGLLNDWRKTPKARVQPLPLALSVHKSSVRTAFAEIQNILTPATPQPPPFDLEPGKKRRAKPRLKARPAKRAGGNPPPPPPPPPPPGPANGYEYSPHEAARILLEPAARGKARVIVAEWKDQGLIPVGYSAVMGRRAEYVAMLQRNAANQAAGRALETEQDAGWNAMGPKLLSTPAEMRRLARVVNGTGIGLGNSHVAAHLAEKETARRAAEGKSSIGAKLNPDKRTVAGYKAMAACTAYASTSKTTASTEKRYNAVNSLRNAASLAAQALVACTLPGVDIVRHAECSEAAAKGRTDAQRRVSEYNGGVPVALVAPSCRGNIDDTTCFTFKDQGELILEDYVVSQQNGRSGADRSHSCSNFDDASGKMGIRVTLTQGINAGGMAAPLCLVLKNLNERELSPETCPSGCLVIPIAGLNIASGASLDALSSGTGYLVLLRKSGAAVSDSGQSPEQVWLQHYLVNIYVPWVNQCRSFLGAAAEDGVVPPHLTATLSSDGCGAQLRAVCNPAVVAILNANLVVATKNAAACTATQQALDAGAIFKLIKRYLKSDKGHGGLQNSLMVSLVTNLLNTTEGINLAAAKVGHVAAFCGRVPNILASAMTTSNIKKSFEWCGQLVAEDGGVNVEGCWATCLRSRYGFLSTEEESLLRDSLPELYEIMSTTGHIAETDFDRLGYPQDRDPSGAEVPKLLSAAQEDQERNKIVNHHHQVLLRAARVGSKAAAIKDIAEKGLAVATKHLAEGDKALRAMVRALKGGDWLAAAGPLAVAAAAEGCKLEHVAAVNSDALQSFIRVRVYRSAKRGAPTAEAGWAWPKGKGNANDAGAGVRCHISEAFRLRSYPVLMEKPEAPAAVHLPAVEEEHDTAALPELPQATVLALQRIAGSSS